MSRTGRIWLAGLLLALAGGAPAQAAGEASAGSLAKAEPAAAALEIFGVAVPAGERRRLDWTVSESFTGASLSVPIQVIHGSAPGRTLCLTAGIHGDELDGVEIVRRAAAAVEAQELGDLQGFERSSCYNVRPEVAELPLAFGEERLALPPQAQPDPGAEEADEPSDEAPAPEADERPE